MPQMILFLSEEQDEKIKEIKKETGKSKNDIVTSILEKYIKNM